MNKICATCNIEKDISNFYKRKNNKDGFEYSCKECLREYRKQHYNNNKQMYFDKNNKRRRYIREFITRYKKIQYCSKCGEKRWYVLDFHHDENNKEYNLSKIECGIEKIKKEIRKCIVLCSNCHRELHFLKKNGTVVQ